jgi:hypothetical protein
MEGMNPAVNPLAVSIPTLVGEQEEPHWISSEKKPSPKPNLKD